MPRIIVNRCGGRVFLPSGLISLVTFPALRWGQLFASVAVFAYRIIQKARPMARGCPGASAKLTGKRQANVGSIKTVVAHFAPASPAGAVAGIGLSASNRLNSASKPE